MIEFSSKGKADSRNDQSFSLPLLLTTKQFGLKTKELTTISVWYSRQNLSYQLEQRIRILTPKRISCYLFFSKLVHTDTQINRWQKRLKKGCFASFPAQHRKGTLLPYLTFKAKPGTQSLLPHISQPYQSSPKNAFFCSHSLPTIYITTYAMEIYSDRISNWRAPPTRTGFPKINSFFAEDEKQITEQRTLMNHHQSTILLLPTMRRLIQQT